MKHAPQTSSVPVQSSVLAAIGYGSGAVLELHFRSGAIYRYAPVPPAIVQGLLLAESKGSFFNRHIRDRFSYQRLS